MTWPEWQARVWRAGVGAVGVVAAALSAVAAEPQGPADAVEHWLASAEAGLAAGEPQIAESHYRSAVAEGFMALGSLEAAEGRLERARRLPRRHSLDRRRPAGDAAPRHGAARAG